MQFGKDLRVGKTLSESAQVKKDTLSTGM